jgi:hypothetical protein
MEPDKQLAQRVALHGERMIQVTLRFWTNDIAEDDKSILPRNAWTSGVVSVERNKSHGIKPLPPKPFHTLLDLSAVIESVLIAHGITLHPSRKMDKYVKTRPRRNRKLREAES